MLINVNTPNALPFVFNDAGRAAAGYKGFTGDCTCRALTIAMQEDYESMYQTITCLGKQERSRKGKPHGSARTGIRITTIRRYLAERGWVWHPTMFIGSGTTVHLRKGELPMGRLIVQVSRHMVAVIDGVIHDNHDCSRGGRRAVYGYWSRP